MYISITFLPDIRDFFDNPVADVFLSCCLVFLLFLIGLFVIFMPYSHFFKIRPCLSHTIILLAILLYSISLSLLFVFISPIVPRRVLHEFTVICGSVGLTFGVLVVYDNMKGVPLEDTYNNLMQELKDIERQDTSCATNYDDIHRDLV